MEHETVHLERHVNCKRFVVHHVHVSVYMEFIQSWSWQTNDANLTKIKKVDKVSGQRFLFRNEI